MPTLHFPLSCFVGLAVAAAEVTVPGYVRQPMTLAYCADGVTIANLAAAQWQNATQSWGVIDTVQLWDSATGGVQLASLPVDTAVLIAQYDQARIPPAGVEVLYASVPRPYGTGSYGTFPYGVNKAFQAVSVMLERVFQQRDICTPGAWTPADPCESGAWAAPPACSPGTWTPTQQSVAA